VKLFWKINSIENSRFILKQRPRALKEDRHS